MANNSNGSNSQAPADDTQTTTQPEQNNGPSPEYLAAKKAEEEAARNQNQAPANRPQEQAPAAAPQAPARSAADDARWQEENITVQVRDDESAWMHSMEEMSRDEMIEYAIFQYGVPRAAAENVGRNDLVQLVVMANRSGGSNSVQRPEYRYKKFGGGGRQLYLCRGTGENEEIFDGQTDKWIKAKDANAELAPAVTARATK
jgi:hypothetical protein